MPSRLADEVVALRPLREEDAVGYAAAFRAEPTLGTLLGYEQDPDERSLLERIDRRDERAAEGEALELAIVDPVGDRLWGSLTFHSFAWEHRRGEIGFWIDAAMRRQGIGSDAVSLALTWGFGALDLLRVEMTTTPDNLAVRAVARRLGFSQEGVLRARNVERGRRVDVVWFGLLREEWPGAPAL